MTSTAVRFSGSGASARGMLRDGLRHNLYPTGQIAHRRKQLTRQEE